ncbi:MAG: hypothetical protein ABR543_04380 [Gemmatimonadaceae bacterium]
MSDRLKPITREGVPSALQKAERYRLLNDSSAAESICLDVLEIDPANQQAIVMLLLSITDQFAQGEGELSDGVRRAREVLPRIDDEYRRAYYAGIICERRAKAQLAHGGPSAARIAHDWFHEAMGWYERAENSRPPGNDESLLRWNTCVRLLSRNDQIKPLEAEAYEPSFE